jgi:opacity protein-like surface antigen
MKKLIAISVFTLLISQAYSQKIRMGLTASPQLSWLTSDVSKISSEGVQMGFNFGMQTDFFFSDRYSITSGIMINNTGGGLVYNDSLQFKTSDSNLQLDPGASVKYKIQYIDVPLAFRMESNQIGYFVYYAQFGITNHIRVGASANVEGMQEEISISVDGAGCKDEVDLFNMGYNIGAGINYYFSKNTAITLGILYTNGFIDVTSNKSFDDATMLKSFTLKIGLLF